MDRRGSNVHVFVLATMDHLTKVKLLLLSRFISSKDSEKRGEGVQNMRSSRILSHCSDSCGGIDDVGKAPLNPLYISLAHVAK